MYHMTDTQLDQLEKHSTLEMTWRLFFCLFFGVSVSCWLITVRQKSDFVFLLAVFSSILTLVFHLLERRQRKLRQEISVYYQVVVGFRVNHAEY